MATNYGVNGGRSNRNCPAKELALLLGKLFFEELFSQHPLRCVLWLYGDISLTWELNRTCDGELHEVDLGCTQFLCGPFAAMSIIDGLQEFDVSAWEAKDANIHIDSRGASLKDLGATVEVMGSGSIPSKLGLMSWVFKGQFLRSCWSG